MTPWAISAVRRLVFAVWLLHCAGAAAQQRAALTPPPAPAQTVESPTVSGPVLPLYHALLNVGLDPQRVFQVREAAIDREDVHIWLNDGTIAFTQAVDGRITGAYFEGEGEVLVRPPDRMERASLGLFINAGVLEEKFSSGYFRFNDDTGQGAAAVSASAGGCCRFRRPQRWPGAHACGNRRDAALYFLHQRAARGRFRRGRRRFPIACCTLVLPANTMASSTFSSTPAARSKLWWATLPRTATRSITTCG